MTPDRHRDRIYSTALDEVEAFQFDRRVAEVFPDMIGRSVPGYASVINMTGVLAARYVAAESNCYDLGCALGASAIAMARGIETAGCRVIGVDNAPEMLQQARRQIPPGLATPVELIQGDACTTPIRNASMVVLNFTLQFIPPDRRLALLQRIYRGLRPGGILVLSEKIRFQDPVQEQLQIEMHHAFKRANGYNDLEISQKRSALEQVLIPETLARHRQRLQQAGFERADVWFQCFNFISLVARR